MIQDSTPWKDELLRIASSLEKRCQQKRWSERRIFLLERDLMLGSFALRKLCDSLKVSTHLRRSGIPVIQHRLKKEPLWRFDWTDLGEIYDLDSPKRGAITPERFANQFIHSAVWMPEAEDPEYCTVSGFWVVSDLDKQRHVNYFAANDIVKLFRTVGEQDIAAIRHLYTPNGERVFEAWAKGEPQPTWMLEEVRALVETATHEGQD